MLLFFFNFCFSREKKVSFFVLEVCVFLFYALGIGFLRRPNIEFVHALKFDPVSYQINFRFEFC